MVTTLELESCDFSAGLRKRTSCPTSMPESCDFRDGAAEAQFVLNVVKNDPGSTRRRSRCLFFAKMVRERVFQSTAMCVCRHVCARAWMFTPTCCAGSF